MTTYKVHVGNLSFATTEDDLRAMFSRCGKVVSTSIPQTRGHHSRGFGFVDFESEESVKKAISKYNDKEVGGRKITVAVASYVPKEERKQRVKLDDDGDDGDSGAMKLNRVFVGGLSRETTEEDLRAAFGKFGEISGIRIPLKEDQPRGFAFIEFQSSDDAGAAVEAMDGKQLNKRTIKVNISAPNANRLQAAIKNEDEPAMLSRRKHKHRHHHHDEDENENEE